MGAPVHVIALGDTTFRKDVRLDRVLHNDVAGLGNRFPIEVEVGGQGVEGTLGVTLTGQGLRQRQDIRLQRGGAPVTLTFLVEADLPGIRRYTVAVDAVEGEVNLENNRRNLTIDVIERRKRLLLIGPAPHPDQGAWANALSGNANYEVVQSTLEEDDLSQTRGTACSSLGLTRGGRMPENSSSRSAPPAFPPASSWTPKPISTRCETCHRTGRPPHPRGTDHRSEGHREPSLPPL